jgi:hypothetical protein
MEGLKSVALRWRPEEVAGPAEALARAFPHRRRQVQRVEDKGNAKVQWSCNVQSSPSDYHRAEVDDEVEIRRSSLAPGGGCWTC